MANTIASKIIKQTIKDLQEQKDDVLSRIADKAKELDNLVALKQKLNDKIQELQESLDFLATQL